MKALRLLLVLAVAALVAIPLGLWLTAPERVEAADLAGFAPDPVAGEAVFHAAGCAGCHAAPGATGDARLVLAGGRAFASPFGTFHAPNISSDPVRGVGAWTDADLASAIQHGTSPDGAHYYPAFPYAAYGLAETADVVNLVAYLRGLPASDAPSLPHDVAFPFDIRLGIGAWKALYLPDGWAVPGELPPEAARGRYIAEALAHCGECHTPRDALGGLRRDQWLAGAPQPLGRGAHPRHPARRLGLVASRHRRVPDLRLHARIRHRRRRDGRGHREPRPPAAGGPRRDRGLPARGALGLERDRRAQRPLDPGDRVALVLAGPAGPDRHRAGSCARRPARSRTRPAR